MTDSDDAPQPPLNREQRRAQKFHKGAGNRRQDNLQTQRQNASGFLTEPPAPTAEEGAAVAIASGPEEGPTRSGAGTGGAVEDGERLSHHEGVHLGNQPNS